MGNTRREFVQHLTMAVAGSPFITRSANAGNTQAINKNGMQKDLLQDTAEQTTTTADILIDRLIGWKVEFIFGVIGDGINYIIEAIRKREDKIKLITTRHEEAAAFMASGYAKYTGKLGACIATTGPGAVHLMNGLYDAAMEGAPVIAITGSVFHDLIGTYYTQEVDTVSLMKDVAQFNQMVTGPRHALTVVDIACRTALTTPGVVHLTISKDVQHQQLITDKVSKGSENLTGSDAFTPRVDIPADNELAQAADLLNSTNKICILAGRGALKAGKEIEQLAEKLGAPVAKALLGKALLPDDSPYTTGGTGHLGTLPSKQMMQECEVLLILGSTMPHLEYYPANNKAKAIQIDRDPKRISLRYPVYIGLVGDVQGTLQKLLPKIKTKSDKSFLTLAQQRMQDWRKKLQLAESKQSTPIKPQFLVAEASKLLKDDAAVAIDTGAHTVFTARHLKIKAGQQVAVCGNLASMAPGLPYAISAQLAYPNRQCVAFVGDGGFTMLMGEMATAVMYNLPIKIIVFKNGQLAMDRFEQEEMGNKDYGIWLQPIDFAGIAKACGAEGYSCSSPGDVSATLQRAFASNKPAVIEVVVDPDEEPATPDKV